MVLDWKSWNQQSFTRLAQRNQVELVGNRGLLLYRGFRKGMVVVGLVVLVTLFPKRELEGRIAHVCLPSRQIPAVNTFSLEVELHPGGVELRGKTVTMGMG